MKINIQLKYRIHIIKYGRINRRIHRRIYNNLE